VNLGIIDIKKKKLLVYEHMDFFMGYFQSLWNNQPNTIIGGGIAILVFLGIYIALLNTYK